VLTQFSQDPNYAQVRQEIIARLFKTLQVTWIQETDLSGEVNALNLAAISQYERSNKTRCKVKIDPDLVLVLVLSPHTSDGFPLDSYYP